MSEESPLGAWALEPLSIAAFRDQGVDRERLSPARARHLLSYSLLAPTAHNTVPQLYRLDLEHDRIQLLLDRRRVLPASDPTGREALISIGCAVENLARAAEQYGLTCLWQVSSDLDWDHVKAGAVDRVRIGHVELTGGQTPDDETRRANLRAIIERRVVRAEYDPSVALPGDLQAELEGCAETTSNVKLRLFQTGADKFAWGKLDEMALKHKLEEEPFRRELGQWLLPNGDRQSTRGMRGQEFGLDDRLTEELAAKLRGELDMAGDQLAFLARAGRVGLTSASAVCVLSSASDAPATAIDAGRIYQRCSLLAWRHGFSQAVHTAVCKVPHARAMAQATLMGGAPPTVAFRLGKPLHAAEAAREHSSRPALDHVLIPPQSIGPAGRSDPASAA